MIGGLWTAGPVWAGSARFSPAQPLSGLLRVLIRLLISPPSVTGGDGHKRPCQFQFASGRRLAPGSAELKGCHRVPSSQIPLMLTSQSASAPSASVSPLLSFVSRLPLHHTDWLTWFVLPGLQGFGLHARRGEEKKGEEKRGEKRVEGYWRTMDPAPFIVPTG